MHTSTTQPRARPIRTTLPAAARLQQPLAHQPPNPNSTIRATFERTLLYQTLAEHFETWFELASAGQFDGQSDHHTPKPFVRQVFAKYF